MIRRLIPLSLGPLSLGAISLGAWLLASSALAATEAPAQPTPFTRAIASAKSAMMGEPKAALGQSLDALSLARREPMSPQRTTDIATAQWLEGEALLRLDRARDARPVLDEALKSAIAAAPNSKLHADLLMAQAGLMSAEGKVQTALSDFQAAYRIFGGVGQLRGQAKALQFIGSIYEDAGDYPRVLKYYEQSAELYPNDPALLMAAYNNTANAYKEQKLFAAAETDFRRALAVATEMKSPPLQARILSNLASAQVEEGNYAAASRSVAEGLRAAGRDPEGAEWRPFLWGVSARAALKQGQVQTARNLLERMFQGVDLAATNMTYRDFHRTAYETYLRLDENQLALTHLLALKRLDDQARTLAASTNTALMSAQFDYANQVSRIGQLKAGQFKRDMQLARSRNTIQMTLLGAAGAIMCLLTGAFFWIRRGRNEVRLANAQLSTANRSLEKALHARSDFLATTSHEIRTPLNGILGMTQVMLANPTVDPVLREQIRLVHTSGETMRDMVNDILDVAKIESGKLEIEPVAFDLPALLREAVELWSDRARQKGLELHLDVERSPHMVLADAARVRQVVVNLVSNAIKFTDAGRVTLSAASELAGDDRVLMLSVSDTGIGIAPADVSRVFESFSQIDSSISRLYAGTGLGLSICKSVAEAMGGDITLTSKVGEGSIFTLRLPLREATASVAPEPQAAISAAGLQQCRVLIVDPDPLAQSVIRAMLGGKVRAIETVGSAAQASGLFARSAFDLVIVDAAALSGDGAPSQAGLGELTGYASGLLAVLSTRPTQGDIEAFKADGAGLVITKPVSAASLVEQLDAAYAASMVASNSDGRAYEASKSSVA